MYKITLSFQNPVTGDTDAMVYQFDPAALTQAKWTAAFPSVKARMDALVASSTPKEPATW